MDWLENVMQISNDDIVLVVKQRDGSYIVSYQDQNERYRVELPSLGSEALVSPIRAENTYGAAFLNGYLKTNRNALRSAAYASIMSSLAGMSDEPFKYDKELATIRTREYTALARSIQPQLVEKEQLRAEGR